jgi:hypothetical protein
MPVARKNKQVTFRRSRSNASARQLRVGARAPDAQTVCDTIIANGNESTESRAGSGDRQLFTQAAPVRKQST